MWLDDVADEPHPASYDLCRRHATAMTVPNGWELRDARTTVDADLPRRTRVLTADVPEAGPTPGTARLTGIFADLFYAVAP